MKNLLLFLLAATLFACSKDESENKFDLDEFFDKHKPKEQVFSFSSDSVHWKTIVGEKGGVFEFNTGPFYNANINQISGDVTMKVAEVYSKSDIIFNRLHTTDVNNYLLKSAGMMNLKFESNGQRVFPSGNLKISVPANNYYYQGSELYFLSPTYTSNAWGIIDSSDYIIDSCGASLCYSVINMYYCEILNHFDWLNCDYPIDTPFTNISVDVLSEDTVQYHVAYVVLKNYMSVMGIYTSLIDNSLLAGSNIPVAEPVTVIVIGTNAEGVVYSGIKEFIVSENIEVDVPMNPTTEEELLAAIRALD
jgi:hypothetical protein